MNWLWLVKALKRLYNNLRLAKYFVQYNKRERTTSLGRYWRQAKAMKRLLNGHLKALHKSMIARPLKVPWTAFRKLFKGLLNACQRPLDVFEGLLKTFSQPRLIFNTSGLLFVDFHTCRPLFASFSAGMKRKFFIPVGCVEESLFSGAICKLV